MVRHGYGGYWAVAATVLATAYLPGRAAAETSVRDGWGILRLWNDNSRCIDLSKDRVWITIRSIVIGKGSSWFHTDKTAGVIITTKAEGLNGGDQEALEFPRMEEVKIADYRDGSVILPLNFNLIADLKLKDKDRSINALSIDFTVVKKRDQTGFAKGLNSILSLSQKVAFPANPFTAGVKKLGELATNVVGEVAKGDASTAMLHEGKIVLNFAPTGDCSSPGSQGFERTGIIAVIRASNDTSTAVDIGTLNSYSWRYRTTPAFSLERCVQAKDRQCTQYAPISNEHYGFLIMAVSDTPPQKLTDRGPAGNAIKAAAADIVPPLSAIEIPNDLAADLHVKNPKLVQSELLQLKSVTMANSFSAERRIAIDIKSALEICAQGGVAPTQCVPSNASAASAQ